MLYYKLHIKRQFPDFNCYTDKGWLPEWLNSIDPQGFAESDRGSAENDGKSTTRESRGRRKVKEELALGEVVTDGACQEGGQEWSRVQKGKDQGESRTHIRVNTSEPPLEPSCQSQSSSSGFYPFRLQRFFRGFQSQNYRRVEGLKEAEECWNKVSALVNVYIREGVCPPLEYKNLRPNHTRRSNKYDEVNALISASSLSHLREFDI
jgi:hypothetical protein